MLENAEHNLDTLAPRHRLVTAALRLFAEKGFENATTREICIAARANISAIRYYFGDKAGLYRAAFKEPLGNLNCHPNIQDYGELPIAIALARFFKDFLEPLKAGEEFNLVMKLHFREMLEPTGLWEQEIDSEIKPQHQALVILLKQHLGFAESADDDDLHRLAFAIIGMAVYFYVGQEVVTTISPDLLSNPQAIDILAQRLAAYAISMIDGEFCRRRSES